MSDAKGSTQENNSSFEPTDKIEEFLTGFIAFVKHFLFTLRDLAFNQSRISHAIIDPQEKPKYTKPVTFITLVSFLAIRIFRFGVLTVLLSISTPSCTVETYTETQYPSFLDELTIPTFSEIILYGIPTLIIVLLLSQLLKFIMLKAAAESSGSLLTVSYYSVGFQYMVYLAFFFLLNLFGYIKLREFFLSQDLPADAYEQFLLTIFLLFYFWIVLVFYRLLVKTIRRSDLRLAFPILRQVWLFLWCLILTMVTTYTGVAIAYSLAKPDVENYAAKPVLAIGLLDYRKGIENDIQVAVIVRNNSGEEISLRANELVVYGVLEHSAKVLNSCRGPAPVIVLPPDETCWMEFTYDRTGFPYDASVEDSIRFKSVSPDGRIEEISAYIRSGEEGKVFEISKLDP